MQAVYDYRYVITCSSLPVVFKREFRKLVRNKIDSSLDARTGRRYAVPAEAQCRRIAVLLEGFRVLRAGGFASESPWNLRAKHLRYLRAHWSTEGLPENAVADKLRHWREFVVWINKRALLPILSLFPREAAPRSGDTRTRSGELLHDNSLITIPVLTEAIVMAALTEHRGNLRKAARALGTTTAAVCHALTGGRARDEAIPGLTILN
ncbi:hypothetical protein PQR05_19175 [Paraburkholderia sediminicola]|uniref:Uncharacterized protein n=1 Tax=Paraburkholderia metrosideri TaxID=580937 RepID=A0ABW9DLF3_9BURK